MCFSCFSKFNPSEIFQLQCLCRYCHFCLVFKLKEVTDGKMVLNKYEINHLKGGFCLCKGTFDFKEVLHILNEPFIIETNKAKQRLTQLAMTICCYCHNLLIESGANEPKKLNMKLKIKKMLNDDLVSGIDYYEHEHSICGKCINKLVTINIKRKKKNENRKDSKSNNNNNSIEENNEDDNNSYSHSNFNKEKNDDLIIFHCRICDIDHYIEAKDLESKRESICCSQQCRVF